VPAKVDPTRDLGALYRTRIPTPEWLKTIIRQPVE